MPDPILGPCRQGDILYVLVDPRISFESQGKSA